MSTKQLEREAHKWASEHTGSPCPVFDMLCSAFLAGAASRQAEIHKLRGLLSKAAMEINGSGPVHKRIRMLKTEWSEYSRGLRLQVDGLKLVLRSGHDLVLKLLTHVTHGKPSEEDAKTWLETAKKALEARSDPPDHD